MRLSSPLSFLALACALSVWPARSEPTNPLPPLPLLSPGQKLSAGDQPIPSRSSEYKPGETVGELNAEQTEIYFAKARADKAKHDYAHELIDLNSLIELNPDNYSGKIAAARIERAVLERGSPDSKELIAELDQVCAHDATNLGAFNTRGLLKMDRKDLVGAIADFNLAMACDPGEPTSYVNRALAKAQSGDFSGAHRDLDQAQPLTKDLAAFYYYRAEIWRAEHATDNQQSDLQKVISLNPKFAPGHFGLGMIALANSDFQGAIDFSSTAIALSPHYSQAFEVRGIAELALNNLAAAETDLDQAVRFGPPRNGFLLLTHWITLRHSGATSEADDALLDASAGTDAWTEAIVKYLVGHFPDPEFIEDARKIPATDPRARQGEVVMFRGVTAALNGHKDRAKALFQECIALGRSDGFEYLISRSELNLLNSPAG